VSAGAPNRSARRTGSVKRNKFERRSRLLKHADFERVYKQGRRHFASHLTVFYLRRGQGEGLRVGFTVSKVLGDAVRRNRMKRRLREAVRLEGLDCGAAADVVINPKKSLLTVEFPELRTEIGRAFRVIQQKLAEPGNATSLPGPD
jgi:ribonuclease P protein component